MRRREHEQHAQQHDMSRNAPSLRIVDLDGTLPPHLRALDIEEIDVMRAHVHRGPEEQTIRHLAMEPLAFVQRQPSYFGTYDSQDISAHGEEDQEDVDAEAEAGAAGEPDGEVQVVERGELGVGGLEVPAVGEEEEVEAVEEGVEGYFAPGELGGEPGSLFDGHVCCLRWR